MRDISKKAEKKLFKIYKKTVVKTTVFLLNDSESASEVKIAADIVSNMLSEFAKYMYDFGDRIMTEKQHEELTNIVNECILKIGAKVDSYVPDSTHVIVVAMLAGKMIMKSNQIIYNER